MRQGTLPGTGDRQVFRAAGPQVVWWLWAAFAVINLADLAVQGRDHFAAEVAAFILLVTGVAYACAWRPRVVADDSGITLENPVRDQYVPWSAVRQVRLGRSLEICCSPPGSAADDAGEPAGQGRVLYSWAIQSSRRGRSNADRRARRLDREMAASSAGYARLPREAREMKGKTAAELMTRQLAARADDSRARRASGAQPPGAAGAQPAGRWAWWSIAAMLVPAVLLVVVALV